MNVSNSSNNSSRNSTITSCNWIRRSFEDLDIEVVQTEIMQKRKRKDSNLAYGVPTFDRKLHSSLSFSSSSTSEDFHNGLSSKDVPYGGNKNADNCIECKRITLGQVIDDYEGLARQSETKTYPCDCPIGEIYCCDTCCSSYTTGTMFHESEDVAMVCHEKKFLYL